MRTILLLTSSVLVPRGSTTVTADWYWSKNTSECGMNITEEKWRFTIITNKGSSHFLNVDRITTDLTIESPETDTGYYWCQVNDPSYNGVFISSNKAPVFDTGTMTICSGQQYVIMTTCTIISNMNTPSLSICFISTQTISSTIYKSKLNSYTTTAMSTSDKKYFKYFDYIITITIVSRTTSRNNFVTDLSSTQTDHLLDSASTEMYATILLITTSIILTDNSTSDMKTAADTGLSQNSHANTGRDTSMYTTLITINRCS